MAPTHKNNNPILTHTFVFEMAQMRKIRMLMFIPPERLFSRSSSLPDRSTPSSSTSSAGLSTHSLLAHPVEGFQRSLCSFIRCIQSVWMGRLNKKGKHIQCNWNKLPPVCQRKTVRFWKGAQGLIPNSNIVRWSSILNRNEEKKPERFKENNSPSGNQTGCHVIWATSAKWRRESLRQAVDCEYLRSLLFTDASAVEAHQDVIAANKHGSIWFCRGVAMTVPHSAKA